MPGSSILESSVIMKIFRLEFGHDMSDMLIELDLKLIKKFLYKEPNNGNSTWVPFYDVA